MIGVLVVAVVHLSLAVAFAYYIDKKVFPDTRKRK